MWGGQDLVVLFGDVVAELQSRVVPEGVLVLVLSVAVTELTVLLLVPDEERALHDREHVRQPDGGRC